MHYLEFVIVSAIFLEFGQSSGAGECRRFVGARKLFCYDCDSRYDPYCADPFNKTLPPENKPATRVCHGCCVKFVHKFPEDEWVQRSCTENIIINYFMVDHVCMGEGKGHGKMCFCEENYCNGIQDTKITSSLLHWTTSSHSNLFIISLISILIMKLSNVFTIRLR